MSKFIISKDKELRIYVANKDIESICLAVNSFVKNVEEIITNCVFVNSKDDADIVIEINKLNHPEEFKYQIKENQIVFTGNDDLGVIYGLYDFLENKIGVPPFYMIEGLNLIKKDKIELNTEVVGSFPESRYRGWFINDEDLLGSFKSLTKRDVPDYPYYHDVINPEVMDMIVETALRYKMNLIIPSTLVNIMEPNEKELIKVCSRRGLYVSQHHIEPLGISKYGFKKFAKKNGLNDDFSYISNHDSLLQCYKAYVQEWNEFPRVIFQIGLRGDGDRPFWNKLGYEISEIEKGEIISSALKIQSDIIKEYYHHDIVMTSTLWMEGAELLKKGYLKVPQEAIIVFADVGMSQLFGDDFYNVNRLDNANYGIYYHAAYCHTGPHLAEGVIPEKMEYSYKLAKEYKSLYYTIINACNVKEHTFSLYINSNLAWNNSGSVNEIYDKYVSLYLDYEHKPLLVNAIKTYFNSFKDIGDEYYYDFCHKYNFSYHKYENLPFPIVNANDGLFKAFIYCFYYEQREPLRKPIIKEISLLGKESIEDAISQLDKVLEYIPIDYQNGFKSHWLYESLYVKHLFTSMIYFYDACEAGSSKDYVKAKELFTLSSNELKYIVSDREKYITGYYSSWYDGDHKIDIPFLIKRIPEDFDRILEINK